MECTTRERRKKKEKRNSLVDLCPPRRSSRFHRSSISSLPRANERLGVGFAPRTSVGDFHSSSVILHRLTERIRFRYSRKRRTGDKRIRHRILDICEETNRVSLPLHDKLHGYTIRSKKALNVTTANRGRRLSTFPFFFFIFLKDVTSDILGILPSNRNYSKSLPRTLRQSDIALTRQSASLSKCLNIVGQKNKCMTRLLILCQGNNLQSSHPSTATSVPCTERSAEYRVYSQVQKPRRCRPIA